MSTFRVPLFSVAYPQRCLVSSPKIRIGRPHVRFRPRPQPFNHTRRHYHASLRNYAVKPFLLADIGEGITECQLIQWFVAPGARVEQFDKLCEVQSDKASVEITSPFDGVIKKLHYEADDMALTGKPLVDIDIAGEVDEEAERLLGGEEEKKTQTATEQSRGQLKEESSRAQSSNAVADKPMHTSEGRHRSLATPAVRHLTRTLELSIEDIEGTGRDGRVLKEDVHRHVAQTMDQQTKRQDRTPDAQDRGTAPAGEDRTVLLSPVQSQMFKAMTRSLAIPHFLYTCAADMSAVTALRGKLNARADTSAERRLTPLAFIVKAVSLAMLQHPLLNAHLDTAGESAPDSKRGKPRLTFKARHDFGIAIDTPAGLVVPVLRNVRTLSIASIAAELRRLSQAARENKLTPADFGGATFTISNIGSVGGGGVVAPVISEPQVAILGVGRSRIVPAWGGEDGGQIVRREELVLSWSADHRVVDGAECARCAERVKGLLEEPAGMLVEMR